MPYSLKLLRVPDGDAVLVWEAIMTACSLLLCCTDSSVDAPVPP